MGEGVTGGRKSPSLGTRTPRRVTTDDWAAGWFARALRVARDYEPTGTT